MRWIASQISGVSPTATLDSLKERESTGPIQNPESGGFDLSSLYVYGLGMVFVSVCMMFATWSRIQIVETTIAIDAAQSRHLVLTADMHRLQLEETVLTTPSRLETATQGMGLTGDSQVVVLTEKVDGAQ